VGVITPKLFAREFAFREPERSKKENSSRSKRLKTGNNQPPAAKEK
jgi:hypothetical protein